MTDREPIGSAPAHASPPIPSESPTAEPPARAPVQTKGPGEPLEAAPGPEAPDWEGRFKYLLADFENFRKRIDRDRESIKRRAEADILRTFLPIHDAFERARSMVSSAAKNDPVRQGMELLEKEWDTFLKRQGVEPVASRGTPFDMEEHEAVGEVPASADAPPGQISEVVQQGYRFSGGLLRPAKVLVAAAEPPAREPGPVKGGSRSAHEEPHNPGVA